MEPTFLDFIIFLLLIAYQFSSAGSSCRCR